MSQLWFGRHHHYWYVNYYYHAEATVTAVIMIVYHAHAVSIVAAVIGAILLLGLIAFIISGIYKAKERSKMKKAPKTTIFEE